MTDDPVAALATAHEATGRLVAGVRADQWELPTPCSEWTVRQLVNHLVGGTRMVSGALRGEPLPSPGDLRRRLDEDQLGDDAVAAYRDSDAGMLAAFGVPGVLERSYAIPAGTLPGPAVLHVRTVEALVHGWDLAVATGQQAGFPDDVAAGELAFSRGLLGQIPPDRRPFGPPQPVPDDAPALDRLVALLGRAPGQTGGRSS
jgi:uncharacterized protein (TIGR03086 family)